MCEVEIYREAAKKITEKIFTLNKTMNDNKEAHKQASQQAGRQASRQLNDNRIYIKEKKERASELRKSAIDRFHKISIYI